MTSNFDVQAKFHLWAQPTNRGIFDPKCPSDLTLCCMPSKKDLAMHQNFLSIFIMVIMTCIISAFLLIGI